MNKQIKKLAFQAEGKEQSARRLVGRMDGNMKNGIEGDYYICDYIFNHGAVATVLRPVLADERDDRTNPNNPDTQDYFLEAWQEAVKADSTRQSFKDWLEEVLADENDEAVFDLSGSEYWDLLREAEPELTEEAYPIFECVGGGRSFSANMHFDKIYDKDLWTQIQEVEK